MSAFAQSPTTGLPPAPLRRPARLRPVAPLALALALALLSTSLFQAARAGGLRGGAFVLGGGCIRFHDGDLDALYGTRPAPLLGFSCAGPLGLTPAVTLQLAWSEHTEELRAFIEEGGTRMLFLPVSLQVPLDLRMGSALRLRIGPQISWAYLREEWNASVPDAGIEASDHEAGSWLAAGLLGELWMDVGPPGSVGLSIDWNWSAADRGTARGNQAREAHMEGGWSGLRLAWMAPWPRRF